MVAREQVPDVSLLLVLAVGTLVGTGVYLLLDRSLTRLVLGLALLGHAAVLFLQLAGGPNDGPPLLVEGAPTEGLADPLPQALALTAIVITFAVTAFLLALAVRSQALSGSDAVPDDPEDRRVARTRGVTERDRRAQEAAAREADDEVGR